MREQIHSWGKELSARFEMVRTIQKEPDGGYRGSKQKFQDWQRKCKG